jgi:hypothetical protein
MSRAWNLFDHRNGIVQSLRINYNTALLYDRTSANGGQAGDAARVASHQSCGNPGKACIIGSAL